MQTYLAVEIQTFMIEDGNKHSQDSYDQIIVKYVHVQKNLLDVHLLPSIGFYP
jgi:hypothetical protein